jgi:MFS family permease
MNAQQVEVKNNFGAKGWGIIIYSMYAMFLNTGATVDGANATITTFAEAFGWDSNVLLNFSTIAGLFSLLGIAFFGALCQKLGPRKIMFASGILAGISYIWYAHSSSLVTYLISYCLVNFFTIGLTWVGTTTLCTNWFPRKKGLVMGWVTIGNNLSTAFFVTMITLAMAALGMAAGLSVVGVLFIICGILALLVKDYPEQAGCYPDNVKPEAGAAKTEIVGTLPSTLTLKDILTRKEVYMITIPCGLMMMCTVGVVSQLIPRIMSFGYSQPMALTVMAICAIIGAVGSYVVGWWDQKWGTKVALMLFAIVFAISLVFNVIPNTVCFYISLALIGFSLGGAANFPVSFTASLFGRRDFTKAFAPINIMTVAIRMLGFSALALFTKITGSVSGAYICFAVLLIIGGLIAMSVNVDKYVEKYPLQD